LPSRATRPDGCTTNWWRFPPETHEIQFDEKWAFVYKKQKHCDPRELLDRHCGDNWDHVAFDAEHRLVLEVIPGKRTRQRVRCIVQAAKRRTGGRIPRLLTRDEYKPYRQEILDAYDVELPLVRTGKPGRPRKPRKVPPPSLLYATVHKTRRQGRVVKVEPRLQFGTEAMLAAALAASPVSTTVNTSFIERHNGTDRHRNSRKVRKTYRFSKDWDMHNASTYFSMYSYNFCWPVRTLRQRSDRESSPHRTPAMAAGLTDHVWTLSEWLTFPAKTQ
jgi:IS1 family transposase